MVLGKTLAKTLGLGYVVYGGRLDRESAMLRASLYALAFFAASSLAVSHDGAAGGRHHHHHGPAMQARAALVPGSVTSRGSRQARPVLSAGQRRAGPLTVASPFGPNPVFSAFPGPVVFNDGVREVLLEPTASTRSINLTINRIPVVMGIRRAPEAAPLIYRIEDGSGPQHGSRHRGFRHGHRAAPDAKVLTLGAAQAARHHGRGQLDHHSAGVQRRDPADTTTPRIIVVRAR
jgi:hypothetical protein